MWMAGITEHNTHGRHWLDTFHSAEKSVKAYNFSSF
jgi:hypothetical protein